MPNDSTPPEPPSSRADLFGKVPKSIYPDHRIDGNAKILFAEILGLAKTEGYCYATNGYFAEMFDVHESTVVRWVRQLEEANYVMSQFLKSARGTERRLYIRNGPPVESLRSDAEALANVIDRVGIPRPSQDKSRGSNSATPASTLDTARGSRPATPGIATLSVGGSNLDTPGVAELPPNKIILRDNLIEHGKEGEESARAAIGIPTSEALLEYCRREAEIAEQKRQAAILVEERKQAQRQLFREKDAAYKNADSVFGELPDDQKQIWRDAVRAAKLHHRKQIGSAGIVWPEMTDELLTDYTIKEFRNAVLTSFPEPPTPPRIP
jgi:hypothetical protein